MYETNEYSIDDFQIEEGDKSYVEEIQEDQLNDGDELNEFDMEDEFLDREDKEDDIVDEMEDIDGEKNNVNETINETEEHGKVEEIDDEDSDHERSVVVEVLEVDDDDQDRSQHSFLDLEIEVITDDEIEVPLESDDIENDNELQVTEDDIKEIREELDYHSHEDEEEEFEVSEGTKVEKGVEVTETAETADTAGAKEDTKVEDKQGNDESDIKEIISEIKRTAADQPAEDKSSSTATSLGNTGISIAKDIEIATVPVIVTVANTEFLLTPSLDETLSHLVALYDDVEVLQSTIEEFFNKLRSNEDLEEFHHFQLSEEITLDAPELGDLKITEDNIYSRDITVLDLVNTFKLLQKCLDEECPKALSLKISFQPRFITRFNRLTELIRLGKGFSHINGDFKHIMKRALDENDYPIKKRFKHD